jgi:magnesium transporter
MSAEPAQDPGDEAPRPDPPGVAPEQADEPGAAAVDVPALASAVSEQAAPDAADTLEALPNEEAAEVLELMEVTAAAAALAEMEKPLAALVLYDLVDEDVAYAGNLLRHMAPDDGADVLQAITPEAADRILATLPPAAALALRRLMHYPAESAGGLMTTEYVALGSNLTVGQAVEQVRGRRIRQQLHDLPVVDALGRFLGLVGMRDLLVSEPRAPIAALMQREHVRLLRPEVDREQVAREFDRYDRNMLPVVDAAGHLLGVVTVDDVIDIIRAEQTEDVQMTVGAGAGEAVYSRVAEKFRGRFPWLGVSLFTTCVAAAVVLLFQDLVAAHPVLAFLLPVIAAMVGNAGHQALAVTLRGIVLGEVRPGRIRPLLLRELGLGMVNGIVLGALMCGLVLALASRLAPASWRIAVVAGAATAVAMSVGTMAGSCVPLGMRRLGIDPAHASAIFLIMITDGVSFCVLLGLSYLLLTA